MKKFTTVFVDVDNTLLDFGKCATQAIKIGFNKHNLVYKDEYFDIFNKFNDILWQKLEKGIITLDELHNSRWVLIFEEIGIKNVDGVTFDAEFVEISSKIGIPVTGALEILEYLSKKYTVCVTSNSSYNRQFYRLTDCKMMDYIDFLFTSGELGKLKPNADFFDACFDKLNDVSKEQVIIIGDSVSADIDGGKNYGLTTCWYNHNQLKEFDDDVADHIIHSLLEIKNIL